MSNSQDKLEATEMNRSGSSGVLHLDEERIEEERWVREAKDGDTEAFGQLFIKYQPRLFRMVAGMLGDAASAEDCVQEGMVRAWQKLRSFDSRSSFGTWLHRIVYRVALDHLRHHRRRPADSLEQMGQTGFDPPAETPLPGGQSDAAHLRHCLDEALATLPEEHRTTFLLGETQGLSYEQIGQIMGCPRGTVMSRMFYARKKLQSLLRGLYERHR